ncbi:MAG TPA: response regulator [Beijerinckiaceae bacterium]|jgi:CheY-like chemotaxis protein|nr:response regulator [Beijerinckiaceae bacterium]
MPEQKLILIVEDDRIIRVLSADLLLEEGLGTLEAADGEEALAILDQRAADIGALVTDVRMPGAFSGVELARRVAVQWPWISILVTSGNFNERPPGLPEQAQFLRKPWRPEAVVDFARTAVRADFH